MTGAGQGLQHRSVLHRGVEDLVDQLEPDVCRGLDRGEAILVCLPDPHWRALSARVGPARAAEVTFRPVGERYVRPVRAMADLAEFVDGALAAGRPAVQSIGAISYTGTPADTPWLRYEAAVNDIFRDVPLLATCATDVGAAAPGVVEALAHVHDHASDGSPPDLGRQRNFLRDLPAANVLPRRPADIELDRPGPTARGAVTDELAGRLTPEQLADLRLVIAELVTNAQLHGPGEHTLRLWVREDHVLVAVDDVGGGLSDPFAGLRPAGLGVGGRGLWIVHHLCHPVDFVTTDEGHRIVARFPRSAGQRP